MYMCVNFVHAVAFDNCFLRIKDEMMGSAVRGTEYDTIRDAILTCARKLTRVGLIYRTETTTENCKTEKLKSKNSYAIEVTVKVWGIM